MAINFYADTYTGMTGPRTERDQIYAIKRNQAEHPDTGNEVTGLKIPSWRTLLELAVRCYELTGLGYQGVDLVLDKEKGPMVLKLNARPGLNIQIANRAGLLARLELVEREHRRLTDVQRRVAFAQERFVAPS